MTSSELRYGADASSEGVQRDLLPIIEGSVVATKHGNVSTDHVLFICSGAFHAAKPSDMLAELQGRLPIRVELKVRGRCRALLGGGWALGGGGSAGVCFIYFHFQGLFYITTIHSFVFSTSLTPF